MYSIQNHRSEFSDTLRVWIFLGAFALLVGLTGGASRYDAIQIIPLRTLSCLFLIPAIYYLSLKELQKSGILVGLIGALVLLTAAQLIPLPHSIWQGLPGREGVVLLDEALGLKDVWRPLTMAPLRTWNALGALIVPATGLLLAISLSASARVLLHVIAGLGVLNAILGLIQIASGRFSPFYLYEITNRGGVVGIFANENHAGIFAACSMLVVVQVALESRADQSAKWIRLLYPAAFFLILFAALVGGSRAGFAAAMGAVLFSFCMIVLAPRVGKGRSAVDPIHGWMQRHPILTNLLPFVAIFATICLFAVLGRASALADLLARDSFADLRWELWPVLADMFGTFWLVGSGFGSFEQVYKAFEPPEMLMPRYVNQAHNDWVQFIIEGGVVAAVIAVCVMVWLVNAIVKLASARSEKATALFWLGLLAIIGSASLIDYPLRTPLFQIVGVWLLLALSRNYRGLQAT